MTKSTFEIVYRKKKDDFNDDDDDSFRFITIIPFIHSFKEAK